jgi:hypothetical protein
MGVAKAKAAEAAPREAKAQAKRGCEQAGPEPQPNPLWHSLALAPVQAACAAGGCQGGDDEIPAVQRLCSACAEDSEGPRVQTRLQIGAPGDPYEQEAERRAAAFASRGQPAEGTEVSQAVPEGDLPRKCATCAAKAEPTLQARPGSGGAGPDAPPGRCRA